MRIIRAIFSDVVVTGFARRVTFHPLFIDALAKAAKDLGLNIRNQTQYADFGNYDRAVGSFATQYAMDGSASGIFNRGGASGNQTFGAHSWFNNRWGM